MPFDSAPSKTLTQKEKLDRLLYHISQSTDAEQGAYCTCLAHRCYTDPVLIQAGLPKQFWFTGLTETEIAELIIRWSRHKRDLLLERRQQWAEFFGMTISESYNIFGGAFLKKKKQWVEMIKDRLK